MKTFVNLIVMASYWKSQPRKFCEICKCWIGDNRASIDFHEKGKSHQEKKKKQLEQIRKRGMQQAKDNARASVFLKQAEQAARKQYMKDLEEQGISVNAEEFFKKEQETKAAIAPKSSLVSKVTNKQKLKTNQPKCTNTTNVLPIIESSATNKQPFGKWTVVEKPSETLDTNPTFAIASTKPTEITFAEKRVLTGAADTTCNEPIAFKKRKTNNRNIRSKLNND